MDELESKARASTLIQETIPIVSGGCTLRALTRSAAAVRNFLRTLRPRSGHAA
jgi:hypothetical protein